MFHTLSSPQVEIGKRKASDTGSTKGCTKKSKKVEQNQQDPGPVTPSYQPGQFVAMCCLKYREYKPQIAKINKMNSTKGTVNITWYDGAYDSTWKIWKAGGRVIKDTNLIAK